MSKANFVIAVNWNDRWLLPACVASIRRFYPDATITLLKDTYRGPVITTRLEKCFKVVAAPVKRAYGGGGWIKLLPAILGEESRPFSFPLMVLDADTLLLGPVFEELLAVKGSVVIAPDILHAGELLSQEYISQRYLSVAKVLEMGARLQDIEVFPWFNSGHVFLREPFIEPLFIKKWVNWDSTPITAKNPMVHPLTDQSLLNHYLLLASHVPLGALDFAEWSGDRRAYSAARERSHYQKSIARVLHYAGVSRIPFWRMPDWRPLFKENQAAEKVMGNPGSLILSHGTQYLMQGVLHSVGKRGRAWLKRVLVGRAINVVSLHSSDK
jgi:hypothetical protein